MSWTKRVQHPSEVVKKGDTVDVIILNIDSDNKRISLGLKQAEEDPWLRIGETYPVGTELRGKVVRLMEKGVVVDIGNDIEGFVPVSQLNNGKPVASPADIVYEGIEPRSASPRGGSDSSPDRARSHRHSSRAAAATGNAVAGAAHGAGARRYRHGGIAAGSASPMSMREKLRLLELRRAESERGGGAARLQQQHDKGKLSARERLDVLLDEGSFAELDRFVTHRSCDFGLEKSRPTVTAS